MNIDSCNFNAMAKVTTSIFIGGEINRLRSFKVAKYIKIMKKSCPTFLNM